MILPPDLLGFYEFERTAELGQIEPEYTVVVLGGVRLGAPRFVESYCVDQTSHQEVIFEQKACPMQNFMTRLPQLTCSFNLVASVCSPNAKTTIRRARPFSTVTNRDDLDFRIIWAA